MIIVIILLKVVYCNYGIDVNGNDYIMNVFMTEIYIL